MGAVPCLQRGPGPHRRLPVDLRAELTAIGCFRLSLPADHGGTGADLVSLLRVFEALSRADASVGWTVMIGSSAWRDTVLAGQEVDLTMF